MTTLIQRDEKIIREIREAARTLFIKYGLKKTTMDDVGRAVGKGKSTLYYYFPGKTELFQAVVSDDLDKILKSIRLAINAEHTSTGKLRAFLLERLELKDKFHSLGSVVHDDIFDNFKEICRLKVEFESAQLEMIREIVTGGVQAGEFRKMDPEEIISFSKWAAAAFSGLDMTISKAPALAPNEVSCSRIIDFILHGIGKRK